MDAIILNSQDNRTVKEVLAGQTAYVGRVVNGSVLLVPKVQK